MLYFNLLINIMLMLYIYYKYSYSNSPLNDQSSQINGGDKCCIIIITGLYCTNCVVCIE